MAGEKYSILEVTKMEELLNTVSTNIDTSIELINNYKTLGELQEAEAYLESKIYLSIEETIKKNTAKIVETNMLRAMVNSVEFNYPPYISRMQEALSYNLDRIVNFSLNQAKKEFSFTVDFTPLGTIEEYAQVIKNVRESMNWSATGKKAAHIWMEKIYKPDREQGRVFRRKIDTNRYRTVKVKEGRTKLKSKGLLHEYITVGPGEEPVNDEFSAFEWVDVTNRYKGLYAETVAERMANMPGHSAPYWYIIENGNTSGAVKSAFGGSGNPYPVVLPGKVIDATEAMADRLIRDMLDKYQDKYEKSFADLVAKDMGLAGGTSSWNNLGKRVMDFVNVNAPKNVIIDKQLPNKILFTGKAEINGVILTVRGRISSKGKAVALGYAIDPTTGRNRFYSLKKKKE